MKEHSVNQLNNFIGGWYLDDTTICDDLINYFKNSKDKFAGHSYSSQGQTFNKDIKDSIDCTAEGPILNKYYDFLSRVVDLYTEKYPWSNNFASWKTIQPPQIQWYPPHGGFKQWHAERTSVIDSVISSRHLVFMTYLNTVTDEGETEFYHQKIKIRPEKGLTLIWGSDWTFLHRGIPSKSQEKFIITGWFNYTNQI